MKQSMLGLAVLCASAVGSTWAQAESEGGAIEEIVVHGSQVDLAPVYAGGQVARGIRTGLLGNLDMMDSPFSGLGFTDDLARAQQATSIGDVLQNDPTVRVAKGFGNFQELYIIRGFPVFSDDMTYNGVYGILPRQFVAAEFVERVEVFRGANSFLNGAAPGGSGVGGAFNLMPKRAPADPLSRLTVGLDGSAQGYAAADFARRFGPAGETGLRVNLLRRDGEASVDDEDRTLTGASIGTDYDGERLRLSADIGYQDHHIDAPRPQVTPTSAAPEPPGASSNFAQPWTLTDEKQLFGALRAEFDANDAVSMWLAFGGRDGEEANVLANPRSDAAGRTSSFRFDNAREDRVLSADAGLRLDFATGAVDHRLILAGSAVDLESKNAFAFSSFAGFAGDLYDPVVVAPPPTDAFLGGVLSDPKTTEEVNNQSIAIADELSWLDGRVRLTLGLRQQWIETRSFDATSGLETSSYDEDALTPSAGLVYRPSERIALYGNYAESLQPGAVAPANSGGMPVLNAGEVLDPFRGEQYEVGVKYDGGRFGSTVSAFSLSRPSAIVENQLFVDDGEERSRGLELSVYGEPLDGLRIVGGFTWLDAELADTQGGVNDGNRPIGVPELQVNLNGEWDFPLLPGLTLEARVLHTSEQKINQANSEEIDAWTRIDAGARFETRLADRSFTARLRVENLADEHHWVSVGGFPGSNYLVLGAPRSLSISASLEL